MSTRLSEIDEAAAPQLAPRVERVGVDAATIVSQIAGPAWLQLVRVRVQFVAGRLARRGATSRVRSIATRHTPQEPTMISRLTLNALVFAVIGTASLAFAATARQAGLATPSATAKPMRVVQLERVVVVARRLPQASL
jgi:hypothetical protein